MDYRPLSSTPSKTASDTEQVQRLVAYTLVVLSGGQGSRLGGADKGLLMLDGQQLAQRLINRFAESSGHAVCSAVLISANRHRPSYEALGYPVIQDLRDGFQGPLAGIEACLQHVAHGPAVIVPADMPDLPEDLPQKLLSKLTGQSIVIAHDGVQLQPLCMALYPHEWRDLLTAWLDNGGRSVRRWLSGLPVRNVKFKNSYKFSNVNENKDLLRSSGQSIQIGALSAAIGYDLRHDNKSG